jgi:hypothetical protein
MFPKEPTEALNTIRTTMPIAIEDNEIRLCKINGGQAIRPLPPPSLYCFKIDR